MLSSESTASGVLPRAHDPSFGHRVIDIVGDLGGEGAPQLGAKSREHAAALVDTAIEQALSAARKMAEDGVQAGQQAENRGLLRGLLVLVIVLAFAFVGVVLWSLGTRLNSVESAGAESQAQIEEAGEHRQRLDANVKALAGHAVVLTESVNASALANYDMLKAIADKVEAKIPGSAERPKTVEAPVTLRYIAGER